MKAHKFEISSDGIKGKVLMNGEEITNGISAVRYEHDACEVPILQIDFIGTDVEINCERVPKLPKVFEPFYISKTKLIESGLLTDEQLESIK